MYFEYMTFQNAPSPDTRKLAFLPTPTLKTFDGIRVARTPEAVLDLRELNSLKTYLHDARSLEDLDRRQTALFESASTALSLAANPQMVPAACTRMPTNSATQGEPIWLSMVCLPVVFTTAKDFLYTNRLELDSAGVQRFTNLLQRSLFDTHPYLRYLRIESLLGLPDALRLTPVEVHSAVQRESRRGAGRLQPIAPAFPHQSDANLNAQQQAHWVRKQAQWSLCPPAPLSLFQRVGPLQPAAFLMVVFVGWTPHSQYPIERVLDAKTRNEFAERLGHFFARDTSGLHSDAGSQTSEQRLQIRVGDFAPVHHALVQAQGQQLLLASERAHSLGLDFEISHHFESNRVHWSGCALDREGDEVLEQTTVVDHVYDTTWRPDSHSVEVMRIAKGFPP